MGPLEALVVGRSREEPGGAGRREEGGGRKEEGKGVEGEGCSVARKREFGRRFMRWKLQKEMMLPLFLLLLFGSFPVSVSSIRCRWVVWVVWEAGRQGGREAGR